jgi:predicted ATPase/class 3 adenylate cyclase/DNA-binding CsgD family transcriptional regulator
MAELPSGTVTFLFTDIEGSTRLVEAGRMAYRAALARHDDIVRQAVATHKGVIFQTRGDGFCAAFASPTEAAHAALDAQRALCDEPWGEAPITARMALHTGEVELHGEEYFGASLHRCARLLDSTHGGQTVLSATTASLVGEALPSGAWLKDLGEHRLRDLVRTERVYQLVGDRLPADFPPLRTSLAIPNNLPIPSTAFVGREQQLQAIRTLLLRTDTRLVTLTGPGGTGKTRLALHVAASLLDVFADGVSFVALASVTDPDFVAPTIAKALDVREVAGRPIVASLGDALRQKQLLVVLDNFEQVIAAAPVVAELLRAAPRVKILATSRAALRLYEEREHPIPPLVLPDQRASPSVADVVRCESVRLFIDRAQAVRPDFVLADDEAADVAEICRRLDGLPLAIELAAARVRVLPPRAMLQRMERRLPLLTGGARDLPARQRTLRDAIAWSYDLLEPDEQALFRRLAVFRGCTLEAAETVCLGELPRPGAMWVALPPLDLEILDGIESLVDKSLLLQERTVDGQPWFRMLETVREFAAERLEESGEAGAVRRRHILWAVRLAEEAESQLHAGEQAHWFAQVEQAHDNLRAALSWCEERGYAEPALRLAVALWWFWSVLGHIGEGRDRLNSLLARFPLKSASSERIELQARALKAAGLLASLQGDHGDARARHEESLALRRSVGDPAGVFDALEGMGTSSCLAGDHATARRYLEEALAIEQLLNDPKRRAMVLNTLGNISYERGELDVARAYYESANALVAEYVELPGIFLSLALVAQEQGAYDEAERMARQSLERCRQAGLQHIEALALAALGGIALSRGDRTMARHRLRHGIAIYHELGDPGGIAQILERFVGLAAVQGQPEDAVRLAGAAATLRERAGTPLAWRGRAKLDQVLAPSRHMLGQERADALWRTGRALSLDDAVAAALAITEPSAPDSGGATALTRREREVAALITRGLTNRQIAEQLVITEGTAANHVNHILDKLGCSSRAQVAVWAADQGLR